MISHNYKALYKKDTIHIFLHLIFSQIHELNKEISKIHEKVMLDGPTVGILNLLHMYICLSTVLLLGSAAVALP